MRQRRKNKPRLFHRYSGGLHLRQQGDYPNRPTMVKVRNTSFSREIAAELTGRGAPAYPTTSKDANASTPSGVSPSNYFEIREIGYN